MQGESGYDGMIIFAYRRKTRADLRERREGRMEEKQKRMGKL